MTLLSCAQESTEPSATATKAGELRGASTMTTGSRSAEPIALADLPEAVARLEALRETVEKALVVDGNERRAASELDSALKRVERSRARIQALPLDELVEASRRLTSTERTVAATGALVKYRLNRVEESTAAVENLKADFAALAALAEQTTAPPAINLRIATCRTELDELARRLASRRTEVLILVDKLAEATGGVAAMKATTESRLLESRRELSTISEEPIWRLQFGGREGVAATGDRIVRDAKRIRYWVTRNLFLIALITIVCFGGTVFLLHRFRPRTTSGPGEGDVAEVASLQIAASPWAEAIPVTVIVLIGLLPQAPVIAYNVAWLIAAPAAALVAVRMLGPQIARTVWVLAAALALAPLDAVMTGLPVAARLVIVLQTTPLAVVLGLNLVKGRVTAHGVEGRVRSLIRAWAWLQVACLVTATAASLLGWVGLASILRDGALGTLGGIVVIVASYLVLSVVLRNLLLSGPAQELRMVRENREVVTSSCVTVLRLVAIAIAVMVSLGAFGLGHAFGTLLSAFLGAKATIGTLSISAGAIAGFVLVIAVAVVLARLLGFVLAEEVLPRFEVRRGTALAISATVRYLVLVAGFVVAAGVAGVDLTTFGFLAGALGVGIGFGLQNIVSNFISGLILLFERPIQVGDTVDVSGAAGSVTEIGIRAPTVRTFDGAEVIVPNADLISKPVTNWTRSNSDRRFDVPVGVAYGSPLEATAQALLAAAARTAGILPAPPPEAFFQSFADSALGWTVRVWMRMDDSPRILSDLKRAMSEELEKAKIEVPFPQRDLHIRSVVPGIGLTPADE
jgi:small-conductance mechanosensitive channel